MTTPFYTGSLVGAPTIASVLECLFSDESGADESFKNWCGDYGYDTDSRSAERTYKAVRRQSRNLRRLFGGDLATALQAADYDTELMAKRFAAGDWA